MSMTMGMLFWICAGIVVVAMMRMTFKLIWKFANSDNEDTIKGGRKVR